MVSIHDLGNCVLAESYSGGTWRSFTHTKISVVHTVKKRCLRAIVSRSQIKCSETHIKISGA